MPPPVPPDRGDAFPADVTPPTRALRLHAVPPVHGVAWLRDGWRAFAHKPFAFGAIFALWVMVGVLLQLLPLVGVALVMGTLPLLALGYMIATDAHRRGQPMHPLHLIAPLRTRDAKRRAALLALCAAYAVAMIGVMVLAERVDQGAFERLMQLMAQPRTAETRAQIDALLSGPELSQGVWMRFGGAALVSVPFWHAPGLVWWGGQGALQSLFSSTLALWRTKGAMLAYFAAFATLMVLTSLVIGLVLSLLGAGMLMGVVVSTLAMSFAVVFYVSMWFSFDDTFGVTAADAAAPPTAAV